MPTAFDSFSLERVFKAAPARVFAAWADPDQKRKWFVDSDGPDWEERDYTLDFRVHGHEYGRFVLTTGPGAGEHENHTVYLDIEENARIVYAYTMTMNGRIHSSSLTTVEFEAEGEGCRLTYTEQGAFYDGSDGVKGRTGGWGWLMDALQKHVDGDTP